MKPLLHPGTTIYIVRIGPTCPLLRSTVVEDDGKLVGYAHWKLRTAYTLREHVYTDRLEAARVLQEEARHYLAKLQEATAYTEKVLAGHLQVEDATDLGALLEGPEPLEIPPAPPGAP